MFQWLDKLLHPKKTIQFDDGSIPRAAEFFHASDGHGNPLYYKEDDNNNYVPVMADDNGNLNVQVQPDPSSWNFASAGYKVAEIKHNKPYAITFHVDKDGTNKEVGCIDLSNGKVEFRGDIDKSAKVFFDLVKPVIDKYLKDKVRKIENLDDMIRGELDK